MRDSRTALGEGDVNSNVGDDSQFQYNASPTRIATNKIVIHESRHREDSGDSLNTQQIDQLKEQFLEEDSRIEDNFHTQEHSERWREEVQRTNRDVSAQIQDYQHPSPNETSTKETANTHILSLAGPLVNKTQLKGLIEDTQFNKVFTKRFNLNTSKEAQGLDERTEESPDTQYIDDLKQRLLEEDTQVLVGDSQAETSAERPEEQQATGVHKEEHVPEKERILSQADETQFIEGIKAQARDCLVDSQGDDISQLEEVSLQDRTVLAETFAESERVEGIETQGSDKVVLFPVDTAFDGREGIECSQSQLPSQNAQQRSFVTTIHCFEQSGGSQVAPHWGADNPSDQPTFHPQNTTNFASSQPNITERRYTPLSSKHNKRKASAEDINRLKTLAMDNWSRESMGIASQTQANDSGPRYGTTAKHESQSQNEGGPDNKKGRSNVAHAQPSAIYTHSIRRREEGMDDDSTYNETEPGAVRLDLTQSQNQAEEHQNWQVSQDRGLKSPSYDFARQDDATQLEPETPATGSKNPFAKSRSAVPMGMSQVFAATQSSPLDPRFLQSEGIRPSSPDMAGLASSPAVRRAQTLPAEASSPSHVELTVASSFQPFDESTQPESVRKARLEKWKAEAESRERIEAQYAHFFVGRTDPGDLRFTEAEENGHKGAQSAKQKQEPFIYESDDGMDVEEENRKRIAAKRLKDKIEKNLREVGDMATGPRNTSPPWDRVRRAASTGRVIVKNDIRGARLRERQRKSFERTTSGQDNVKEAEEVEVPASDEVTKAPTIRISSRRNKSQNEEHRAQSDDVHARDTQGTDSQVTRSNQIIRSSQSRRNSQAEVVRDSQGNISIQAISTQPDSTHRSLEEVEDSYNPSGSAARAKSKLGNTDSVILPSLERKDTMPSSQAKSSHPGTNIPVTSSSHYLRKSNPNSTLGESKASNDTAAEVVPETSPLRKTSSKTASPEKPFGDLSQVVDSPMKSFEDFPMTQEPPSQTNSNNITPSKFVKNTKNVYGKKSSVKERPEQKRARESGVIFNEEPNERSGNEEEFSGVDTPTKVTAIKKLEKAKRASSKSAAAKSAGSAIDEEDVMNVSREKGKKGGRKAAASSKEKVVAKSAEHIDSDEVAEEVITLAKGNKPKTVSKSAGFAMDEKTAEEILIPVKKGRKIKMKIASPPVPEQSQLFCTQIPSANVAISPKTRNRAAKKTSPSRFRTAFDGDNGYHSAGLLNDGNPYSPQNLRKKVGQPITDFEIARKVRKAGAFILDEDSQDSDSLSMPMAEKVSEIKGGQAAGSSDILVTGMPFLPHAAENENSNTNVLATLPQLNTDRGKGTSKKVIPRSLPPKILPPAENKSPDSSPIRPSGRRATRHQPSDLQKQASLPTASTSDDRPLQHMEESDEDDVPIARPVTKRRQDAKIHNSSDAEQAGTSLVKKASKPTSFSKSTVLPPHGDSNDEDESVSPVRPSIEGRANQCPLFHNGLPCNNNHSADEIIHDEAIKAASQKLRASSDVPSTASPGKEASPVIFSNRDSRSVSAVIRPGSADPPHLPPTATGGRVHGTPVAPQQASEYAAELSSTTRGRVPSSPLSEIASDFAEELEEFHAAQATARASRQESTDRSRSGTEMSDALLMPPPETVTRKLDFSGPAKAREYVPPVFQTEENGKRKGKGKRIAERSAGRIGGKKARKITPDDTPSRARGAASKCATPLAQVEDDNDEDKITIVEETPRATPRTTPIRRQGRKASRPSYAESPSTDGSDDGGPDLSTIAERTRSSRTPTTEAGDYNAGSETRSTLFKGMAFAISYKRGNEKAVEDREEVTKLVLTHGGEVIEDFKDLFEKTEIDGLSTPAVSRANSTNTSFSTGSCRGSVQPNTGLSGQDGGDLKDEDLILTDHAKTLGFVAFIGDNYSRKSKFFQALSLGLPCLSSFWIRRCVATKSILQWMPYMLAAGEPRKLAGMVVNRYIPPYSAITARFENTFRARKKMLEGKGVLFLFLKSCRGKAGADNKLKREHYFWLTRALGARQVRRVATAAEARRLIFEEKNEAARGRTQRSGWDIVYVDDGEKVASVKRELDMSEEGRTVKVVSDELVVQSLILGWLEDEDLKDVAWVEPGSGHNQQDEDKEMGDAESEKLGEEEE